MRFACFPHVDDDLRKRKARTVVKLNHATLHASWRHLIKRFPMNAGTVRSLECYLTATGKIAADDRKAVKLSFAEKLSEEYVTYLREVRGFAIHSISNHRRVSQAFLDHADRRRAALKTLQPKDIEGFHYPSRQTALPWKPPTRNRGAPRAVAVPGIGWEGSARMGQTD